MNKISEWYPHLGHLTFPTVFIGLNNQEIEALIDGNKPSGLADRITRAVGSLPGSCVAGLDDCMPTDSATFQKSKAFKRGDLALKMFAESAKVKESLGAGSKTITIRPYRRMDKTREFRLFIKEGELKAVSQRNLERHFKRLEARRELYWQKAIEFTEEVKKYLEQGDYVIDIYFTSTGEILIIDFNSWGEPTEVLLLKNWDRDWNEVIGLKLMAEPIKIGGDVKVSF